MSEKKEVYIYGAGNYWNTYRENLIDKFKILCIFDRSVIGEYKGIPIVSKESINDFDRKMIIIMIDNRQTCMQVAEFLMTRCGYESEMIVFGLNYLSRVNKIDPIRVGILGCGNIAPSMAMALHGIRENIVLYACAARDINKSRRFSLMYGAEKAYGSYDEMLRDPKVDLVYIATPHSEHYKHMMMCLDNNKPILCEKTFTTDAKQAEDIIKLSKDKKLFVAEAIPMLYQPIIKNMVNKIRNGSIGNVLSLNANLVFQLLDVPRLINPELGGGALLELGVYPLSLAKMIMGKESKSIIALYDTNEDGVDIFDTIVIDYGEQKKAILQAGINGVGNSKALIIGTKGFMEIDDILRPLIIKIYDEKKVLIETIKAPQCDNYMEYEVIAAAYAIANKLDEVDECCRRDIIERMQIIDEIKNQINCYK